MEKADYEGPEAEDAHICQKGCLTGRQPYDPTRLKKPLKRVGERGEGKWEEISWEQALDEIADKMLQVRDAHGPESITLWNLRAGVPPAYSLEALMPERALGTRLAARVPWSPSVLTTAPSTPSSTASARPQLTFS